MLCFGRRHQSSEIIFSIEILEKQVLVLVDLTTAQDSVRCVKRFGENHSKYRQYQMHIRWIK